MIKERWYIEVNETVYRFAAGHQHQRQKQSADGKPKEIL